jgi:hypothetical protein
MLDSASRDICQTKLAPHVRWIEIEGMVIIIDLRSGEYFGLDKAHASAWRAAMRGDDREPAIDCAKRERLLAAALARGWLAASAQQKPTPCPRPRKVSRLAHMFPRLWAFLCLVRSYASLRLLGFEKTYSWASSASSYTTKANSDFSHLDSAKAAFSRAERFIISQRGMEDCLPRTLALFVFLRGLGFRVRHCIGIRCFPFAAHAWVESSVGPLPGAPGTFTPITIIE